MKKLILLLCIFWCGFIFYNSGKPGAISGNDSTRIVNVIENSHTKLMFGNIDKRNLDHIVRKNAHAFEYIVLAILVGASFFAYDKKESKWGQQACPHNGTRYHPKYVAKREHGQ